MLCPSSYLARQAEIHFGLKAGSIHVIPLPIGDNLSLERNKETWERGTICYIGRIERRKGVIEWIDCAVSVAYQYPTARFEFIGANVLGTRWMSGEEFVQRRIPSDLKGRFLFRGAQERSSIPQFLRGARMAVVPSRWENFPNTCVEAMCSGLPVIASREGGMVEMIKDGHTGWLAPNPGIEGLVDALKCALETPAERIAEMGREASASICRMCDSKTILENHLVFRRALFVRGATNSTRLPANLPCSKTPCLGSTAHPIPKDSLARGLAIVVLCLDDGKALSRCLQSLEKQTKMPSIVVLVSAGVSEEQVQESVDIARKNEWYVIQKRGMPPTLAKNSAVETVFHSGQIPLGFAFLGAEDLVEPNFVATCEGVLQQCPEVGLVSFWTKHSDTEDSLWIKPCASFPYQWLWNEVSPLSVIRTEALREAGNFRPTMSQGYEDWDIFNAVMAAGWLAVTVPVVLGGHRFGESDLFALGKMRKELLKRFPDCLVQDAKELVLLTELSLNWELSVLREKLARPIAGWVFDKAKKRIRRFTPPQVLNLYSKMKRKLKV
ncbi:MAG: glycosyltransferase [Actinobacteria bacterium]|nr:glycosyltransferase [Actinomycetota bacterium]